MAGFTLVSTQTIIARNAGALYGLEVGSSNMTSYVSQVGSNVDTFLNTVYTNSVGTASTSTVADVLIANLGITGDSTDPTTAAGQAKSYIVSQLNAVAYTARGAVVNNILTAFANLTTDPTFGSFATTWNTKISNAVTYASVSGNPDASFSNVSSTPVGSTFTLTAGVDNKVGSDGDDTFDASLTSSSAITFGSSDTINGGSGTDTLSIQTNLAGTYSAASITGIEKIQETATVGAATINLAGVTGVTTVEDLGSTQNVTFSNVGSLSTGLKVTSTAKSATIGYATSVVSGSADTATVTLSNVAQTTTNGTDAITVAGIETLNIVATGGASTVDTMTTAAATKFVVTGDSNLTVGANLGGTVATIDAAAFTGNLSVNMGAGTVTVTGGSGSDSIGLAAAGNVSLSGGAGNDSFDFTLVGTNNTFTSADTVDGGSGTDTLTVDIDDVDSVAITTPLTKVTNIETLNILGPQGGTDTVNLADISSTINRVNLSSVTNTATTLNMGSGTQTVGLNVAAAITAGTTLTVDAAGSGTSDALTVTNMLTTGNMGSATSGLTVTDFETVTINTGSYGTASGQNLGAVNVGSGNAVVVTGSNGLTLAAGLVASTLNASGMTGTAGLSMGAATTITSITGTNNADTLLGDASSSIDGGSGDDVITGGTGNDTLIGGAGNDTITSNTGTDSINAGDGDDKVVATLASGNTINGGSGTDNLVIATAATATTASGVSGFETLTVDGNTTQNMALFVDNSTFTRINFGDTAGNTITVSSVGSGVTTLGLADVALTGGTFTRLVDTSSNSLIVSGLGMTAARTETALSITDEETVTINTSANSAGDLTITTLTDSDLTSLTVTGAGDLLVTNAIASATALATINASAATGAIKLIGSASVVNMTATGSTSAANTLTGGTGDDVITGGSAADSLTGGAGADSITGGAGADTLLGGTGNDTISGGDGADIITGGTGNDVLTGGNGADVFTFTTNATEGVDTITDFVTGTDTIDVTQTISDVAITSAAAQGALAANKSVYISMNGAAANLTTGGTLTLSTSDMTATTLTNLAAYLSERFTLTNASSQVDVLVINWTAGTNNTSYIYNLTENGTGTTVDAAELTLIGVVTHTAGTVMAAGDLV